MNEIEIQKAMIEGLKERKLKVEKELGEIQTEINEREKIVKQGECQSPIFIGDRLNADVVKKIKLILEKIGYSVEGRTWGKTFVHKGKVFTFNSYQEILDFLSGSTIDFDLTQEERALIVRFTDALNNVSLDLETQS